MSWLFPNADDMVAYEIKQQEERIKYRKEMDEAWGKIGANTYLPTRSQYIEMRTGENKCFHCGK